MNKEIERLEFQLRGCLLKLSNPKFVECAPSHVLEREIQKKEDIKNALEAERKMNDKEYIKVYSHSYVKDGTTYYVYKFQEK